jgi:hypothetical protein
MALIDPPEELRQIGVTVMCGPFFSTLPFPPRKLHTLSHVRYTPHCSWVDDDTSPDPYTALRAHTGSRVRHMLEDSRRYLPALAGAQVAGSLVELKTVLVRSEIDDGRPILMERSGPANNIFSIMGGKIDNIYDVLQKLEAENL